MFFIPVTFTIFFLATVYANLNPPVVHVACGSGFIFYNGACNIQFSGVLGDDQPKFNMYNCPAPCRRINSVCNTFDGIDKKFISCSGYQKIPDKCTLNGQHCPIQCTFSNKTCVPTDHKYICQPMWKFRCPADCEYNEQLHRCIPLNDNAICELINQTLQCPSNCIYKSDFKKCMSTDINIVCGLEYKLTCPSECNLNPYGTKCIANSGTICNITDIPLCAEGCLYDIDHKIDVSMDPNGKKCVPRDINTVCEKLVKFSCPQYYALNFTAPYCTRYNQDVLCRIDNVTAQYPSRLSNLYGNLTCTLRYQIDCTKPAIRSCPSACTVDLEKNNCKSLVPNQLCGSSYLVCPRNAVRTDQGCLLPSRINPICEMNQILFNVTENASKYQLMCGDKWFYG